MQSIQVVKRDGRKEPFTWEKIDRVIEWAGEGLDVSTSQVGVNVRLHVFDGVTTQDLHRAVVKAMADLISADEPDYQYMAARAAMFGIRKEVYGQFEPMYFPLFVKSMVAKGLYDEAILNDYDEYELSVMAEAIDHSRDLSYAYAAVKQLEGKYLVQNRVTGEIYETPQMANMMISACLFSRYPQDVRMDYVLKFYEYLSTFKISLPTPIMAGMRTPTRQFSSCVLISAGDSLDSINAASAAIVKYVSQRAGIGLNVGDIRALGSEIRGGEANHTGLIPFIKLMQAAVKSCSQGGVRGGAATVFYPAWHYEVMDLLVLKNNRGTEANRVRHMDYAVQLNGFLYQRLLSNGKISCFSPHEVPGLLDAFFADQKEFARLYEIYEADSSIRRQTYTAAELFGVIASERASTGRIYIQNVDHCNTHSPFRPEVAPVRQSNLCLEIALPTKPMEFVNDGSGEIALCTLAAFNLGELTPSEFPIAADLLVRGLNELLDYQDYPVLAAKQGSDYRRTLGVGVINYAYWLAKQGLKYSDGSANEPTHRLFEQMQYHLMKASVELAKEKGACPGFHETTYSQGILPIDTYKKDVDSIVSSKLYCDWDGLRADIMKYGMRNSTLSALMPSETSSQISNSTNGIEPPRGLVSVKQSKDGVLRQVVPEVARLRDAYQTLWMLPDNKGYIELVAIMQKFVDQTISANTNYDPSKFPNNKVPAKQVLKDLITGYKLGVKTWYYHNTRDGSDDKSFEDKALPPLEAVIVEDDGCESGACKI
jgi:ribonucleoside-diphosphate reductase alpha chain